MIQVRRSTAVRVGIAVAVLVALGIGFGIGWAVHSPASAPASKDTYALKVGKVPTGKGTTPIAAITTTTAPTTTTTTVTTGPTLATCAKAVTGYYFPGTNDPIELGGLSTVQTVGYGCENQEVLSQAMGIAGHGTVYNSDVINMAQDVCNDYPNSPLCVNG